jgi:hypothetical protein
MNRLRRNRRHNGRRIDHSRNSNSRRRRHHPFTRLRQLLNAGPLEALQSPRHHPTQPFPVFTQHSRTISSPASVGNAVARGRGLPRPFCQVRKLLPGNAFRLARQSLGTYSFPLHSSMIEAWDKAWVGTIRRTVSAGPDPAERTTLLGKTPGPRPSCDPQRAAISKLLSFVIASARGRLFQWAFPR